MLSKNILFKSSRGVQRIHEPRHVRTGQMIKIDKKKETFWRKKETFSREGLGGPRDPRECSKSIPGDVSDLPMLRQLPQLLLRAEIEGFLGRAPVRENGNFCSGEGMWLWRSSENTRKSWKIIKNHEKSRKRIPNTVYISLWAHRRVFQITFWDSRDVI